MRFSFPSPFLLLLLSWASSRAWARPGPEEFCFAACQLLLRPVRFDAAGAPKAAKALESCSNELELTSLYLCTRLFCSDAERAGGLEGLEELCRGRNLTIPSYDSVAGRYSDADIGRLYHLRPVEVRWSAETVLSEVAVPLKETFQLAWDTLVKKT